MTALRKWSLHEKAILSSVMPTTAPATGLAVNVIDDGGSKQQAANPPANEAIGFRAAAITLDCGPLSYELRRYLHFVVQQFWTQ
jgi:hypothetical protein